MVTTTKNAVKVCVARPWSADRASPVAERRSTNGRDDDSRRAEVTTPVDVSCPTDAVRGCCSSLTRAESEGANAAARVQRASRS